MQQSTHLGKGHKEQLRVGEIQARQLQDIHITVALGSLVGVVGCLEAPIVGYVFAYLD